MQLIRSNRQQEGVALLEALVAVVVVALGVLGVLGMQMRTLSDTQTGVRRAQAVRLIDDLSERIKSSPNGLGNLSGYTFDWNSTLTSTSDCKTNACDASKLADYDRAQWLQRVKDTLPLSDATVFLIADETNASNRRQLGVMVSWRENEQRNADGTVNKDYLAGLQASNTGGASCPADRICHIQFIQPTLRCLPYTAGASSAQVFCAQ